MRPDKPKVTVLVSRPLPEGWKKYRSSKPLRRPPPRPPKPDQE
jgi:hypothetical protein